MLAEKMIKINKNEKRGQELISTLDIVKAGLHCSFKISRQMLPLLLMLGWNTFVLKASCNNRSALLVGITEYYLEPK